MTVLGVDVGGTFTDTVLVERGTEVVLAKSPTRPDDPAQGVVESVAQAADRIGSDVEAVLEETERFFHGTTIATNLLLERDGATVGLLTTKGHEDAQRIGRITTRHAGLSVGALKEYVEHEKSPPFASREHTYGVEERVDRDGDVVVDLAEEDLRRGVSQLIDRGVEAIAINFLWGFRNPSHERRAADLVEREYGLPVFTSTSIAPRIGEYERGATTCVAAFVADRLSSYLGTLDRELSERGLSEPILVMQNNGGVIP
ncbi:MAG: hydantoinase/oxoprolinase N-terminal domain-containing protein, partial [Halobacteriales archaeon]|nr:hydantoinase/oxoprolinase N-terminal domain-containing protein [Halobacteriales archaeon]